MTMFRMKDDKKSLLIQEVYQRPLIWKVTDPQYTNMQARWAAYAEIAGLLSDDEIKFSGEMIKLAWKNILDYYNQIRRRNDRAAVAGIKVPECRWQFYHMMHFTKQGKPPVRRRYNWMQPSQIPKSTKSPLTNGTNLDNSTNYPVIDEGELPKPFPIRTPTMSRPARGIPRRKVKLLNKLATVDDTKQQSADCNVTRDSPLKRTPKKTCGLNDLCETPQKRRKCNSTKRDDFVKVKPDTVQFVTRRGRRSIRKRFSLSPPADRTPRRGPSKKRTPPISPHKMHSNVKSSSSNRISSDDPAMIFAEHIVARLVLIRLQSRDTFVKVRSTIDHLLGDVETLLGIESTSTS